MDVPVEGQAEEALVQAGWQPCRGHGGVYLVLSCPAATYRTGVDGKKVLKAARSGSRNLRFRDLTQLVESLGFRLVRLNGSHHIFAHPGIPELVNLQDVAGKAKPYQVRQVLKLVDRYNLTLGGEP